MSIVVLGGSGFIGTRLVNRLVKRDGFIVKIVDKAVSQRFPDLTEIADVRNFNDLLGAIPENSVIVNLAAEHRDDVTPRTLYDDVNVEGARNICKVASDKNINTIVFTSTVAVYGFAPVGTDESGKINPFNDYGRTKFEAEEVFRAWQIASPDTRKLIIVRPTVVFGEQNRGNVYNLLRQLASGRFVMIGSGDNRKSLAYVENVAAFLEFGLSLPNGLHVFNYIDKPDYTMNRLVSKVNLLLGRGETKFRLPYFFGFFVGKIFDIIANVTGKKFPISSIRVKKFCSDTIFNTSVSKTGFIPPVQLEDALERTVRYEFIEDNRGQAVYFSE